MNMSSVQEYLNNYKIEQIQRDLDTLIDENSGDKRIIAFCGIFSSGKSSLINSILKQEFKLPTGGEPVTRFVTYIEYGSVFRAYYVSNNQRVYIDSDKVKEIIQGKIVLSEECREIVLQMPADILQPDVIFLDTPGYEDSKELEELTRDAVRSADVVVFCCSADHFGRKFEQEYFQELEDSIGNFCVVVNHTDVIYTDEEYDKLKEYVQSMVMGRGRKELRKIVNKMLFFTVGAGKYTDLDGLDDFLWELHHTEKRKWRALKAYAERKKLSYGLNKILPIVEEHLQEGRNICETIEVEMIVAHDDMMYQYQSECRKVEQAILSLKGFVYDLLNQKMDIVWEKLENLEKKGEYRRFVQLASQVLYDSYLTLPDDIDMWKQKQQLLRGEDMGILFRDIKAALKQFKIPVPEGKRVKNRGLFGSLLVTTIVSTVTFSPYWDDGYDVEYHGYAAEAFRKIKSKLIPKIKEIIGLYLKKEDAASRPKVPELDTTILDELGGRMEEWQELSSEIKYYLSCLEEKEREMKGG